MNKQNLATKIRFKIQEIPGFEGTLEALDNL